MPVESARRRSIRLAGYDYTRPGAYFVTICSYRRGCIFGAIEQDRAILNKAGQIATDEWFRTSILRPEVILFIDEFVVMPNHIHGIIHLEENIVGARRRRAPTLERFGKPTHRSIGTIVRAYKSAVTRGINQMTGHIGDRIWQRNYYEHVIRGEEDLNRIRRYIQDNPVNWSEDEYYHSET